MKYAIVRGQFPESPSGKYLIGEVIAGVDPGFTEENFVNELTKKASKHEDGIGRILGFYETEEGMNSAFDELLESGDYESM